MTNLYPTIEEIQESVGRDEVKKAPNGLFRDRVASYTNEITTMLIQKNESYGNSALDPVRIFSKASAREQILVRLDDKISRISRGNEYPGDDTIKDLIGYLVLLAISSEPEPR